MTATATFRFYAELNDFVAPGRRGREFACRCARAATTKHMIEALGVPHTEVELVLVNGESVGFDRTIADGDRLAVYPQFERLDITPLLRVRDRALRQTRFVADAHLGGLAKLLRMTGFDTLYDNGLRDDAIERVAAAEHRIVLTRDRDLLKRRGITHGCYVHALRSETQWREVFARLDLAGSAQPFTRCLNCNTPLRPIDKAAVAHRLPPRVRERHQRFTVCDGCAGVFWEGTHWRRMRELVDSLPATPREGSATAASTTPFDSATESTMDQETFNLSIRKFLKTVGVSAQREIEQATQKAISAGTIGGAETLTATMTLRIDGLQLEVRFDGQIQLQ